MRFIKCFTMLSLILGVTNNAEAGFFSKFKNKGNKVMVDIYAKRENAEYLSKLGLTEELNFEVFERAMYGYKQIFPKKDGLLTIIDYSKPSSEKRFYIIDIKNLKVLYHSYVAHGKKSGDHLPTSFSNIPNSQKSSLGFFLTENTYNGQNGYSLVLNGLEAGINDNAKSRAIVIHAAEYSNPSWIENQGRLGRSFGCPALPESISKDAIDVIKNGTVVFVYADDESYLKNTKYNSPLTL